MGPPRFRCATPKLYVANLHFFLYILHYIKSVIGGCQVAKLIANNKQTHHTEISFCAVQQR